MAVALIIVSHSQRLAEGVVELANQMAHGDVQILAAGGMPDGSIGTSVERVEEALRQVPVEDDALILVDLGSAVMIAEMAIEAVNGRLGRSKIANAPLVEGAIIAAVEASIQSDLFSIAQAAEEAATLSKLQG